MRRYLRRVPLLPSLFTLGNAFCGFLAIVKISDAARLVGAGEMSAAAWTLIETAGLLIFLALVFDGLDGKVARLTKQTTEFGAQLDSLADIITFGVTPAVLGKFLIDVHQAPRAGEVLAHQFLPFHPKVYYVCAAIFVLFAVLRLARFSVEVRDPNERAHLWFEGLPSPAAATVVGALVLYLCAQEETHSLSSWLFDEHFYRTVIMALPGVLLGCALLMVSRLPYPHLLNHLLRGRKSFPHLVVAVIMMIVVVIEWQLAVLGGITLYVLSGPVYGLWFLVRGRSISDEVDDDDEAGPEFDELDDDGTESSVIDGPGSWE